MDLSMLIGNPQANSNQTDAQTQKAPSKQDIEAFNQAMAQAAGVQAVPQILAQNPSTDAEVKQQAAQVSNSSAPSAIADPRAKVKAEKVESVDPHQLAVDLKNFQAQKAGVQSANAPSQSQLASVTAGMDPGPDLGYQREVTRDTRSPLMSVNNDPMKRAWSKDWVFEGGMDQNPKLEPLLDRSDLQKFVESRGVSSQAAKQIVQHSDDLTPELLAQFMAMDGMGAQVISQSVGAAPVEKPAPARVEGKAEVKANPKAVSAKAVSGADYLDTLSVVNSSGKAKAVAPSVGAAPSALNPVSFSGDQQGKNVSPASRKTDRIGAAQTLEMSAGAAGAQAIRSNSQQAPALQPRAEISGQVVSGSMAQPRLSRESLMNVSSQIRNIGPQGSSEIRMRLKPDHLGELKLQINTQGNQVAVRVVASSQDAKKVIEESASYLKEALGANQLSLGRFEVVTQAPVAAQANMNSDSSQSQNSYASMNQSMQDGSSQNQSQGREENAAPQWGREPGVATKAFGRPAVSTGRLDVMA